VGAQNGDSSSFLKKVEEYECSVTALEIVQLQMDKQSEEKSLVVLISQHFCMTIHGIWSIALCLKQQPLP